MDRWRALAVWCERPGPAYVSILLVQLKAVWGAWVGRDLSGGDTASYFAGAQWWFRQLKVDILWSPLYTVFYGTLQHLSADAYLSTLLHRLLIVFSVTLLVLAVMRRLLTPGLAWLVAAWWAALPITFDTAYEVHLFALVPPLSAWLVLLGPPRAWRRGAGVAILLAGAVLVRNELVVPLMVVAVICVWWEHRARPESGRHAPGHHLRAYGLPVAVAAITCAAFYARSYVRPSALAQAARDKHTLNVGQSYAFGYQQRHPGSTKNPFLEYEDLMLRQFGSRKPTLLQMVRSNPRAVAEHFAWNLGLTGNGLQVLLFNATSGTKNPDYFPVRTRSLAALLLSIGTLGLMATGMGLLWRQRRFWWDTWLRERALGWLAMASFMPLAALVIVTNRPRPSYLFSLGLFLMSLVGMSILAVKQRWPMLNRLAPLMPLAMAGLLIAVPSCYVTGPRPRPLLELYRRLRPFQPLIARRETVLLVSSYAAEIRDYVGLGRTRVLDYSALADCAADTPAACLDQSQVNVFYVDEALLASAGNDDPQPGRSWALIGRDDTPGARWRMWLRTPAVAAEGAPISLR